MPSFHYRAVCSPTAVLPTPFSSLSAFPFLPVTGAWRAQGFLTLTMDFLRGPSSILHPEMTHFLLWAPLPHRAFPSQILVPGPAERWALCSRRALTPLDRWAGSRQAALLWQYPHGAARPLLQAQGPPSPISLCTFTESFHISLLLLTGLSSRAGTQAQI